MVKAVRGATLAGTEAFYEPLLRAAGPQHAPDIEMDSMAKCSSTSYNKRS